LLLLSASLAFSLLRSAIDAPKHLSYTGEVQVLRFGERKSEAAVYRIEHRAPNMTRRWYLAPTGLFGDSIISRGEMTYSIDVKRSRVVVAQDDNIDDQVAEDDNFALLSANYTASFAPDEIFDGRPVRVVLLTNKFTGENTMRVRIDTATHLVLNKEIYAEGGSLSSQTRYEKIHFTSDIPAAVFDVPKTLTRVNGATRALPSSDVSKVIDTAGFKALGPKYLPEGFTPVEGDVIDIKGTRTLHLLYSDGIRTVSLFENQGSSSVDFARYRPQSTKIEKHDAQYVEEGQTTVLAWAESGLHFTLVGELTLAELQKIAASVVP
jgi:outer membrane lipoprotein-sorting protein